MRAFFAGLFQETNDFSPIPTGLDSFADQSWRPRLGPAPGNVNLLGYGGALERARELGLTVIPGLFASAVPAARAGRPVWAALRQELLADLEAALPVDIVFLFLHGATAAEGCDDCEGDLLTAVRERVGPRVPIGAALDLHGNVSERMCGQADFVAACKEYPHTDFPETGARILDLLHALALGRIRPVTRRVRVPLIAIVPTKVEPAKSLVGRLRALESDGTVLSASLFHGFFGADHPDVGAAVVVTTDGDAGRAEIVAHDLAAAFTAVAQQASRPELDVPAAIDAALAHDGRVVIADRADNPGGGAAGDSTFLLAALLRRDVRDATLGVLWDPVVTDFCHLAGVGATLKLRLGGKVGPMSGDPLDVEGTVLAVATDVRQAWFGRGAPTLPLGKSAALRIGGVDVVVGSVRHQVHSRHAFEGHGIDLEARRLIVVKSTQHFHEAFAALGRVIYCDAPGTVTMDFRQLPYRRITRPLWPLDPLPDAGATR